MPAFPHCSNEYNPRAEILKIDRSRSKLVKKKGGRHRGAHATNIIGVKLSCYCFISFNAVVNKNFQNYALVVGTLTKQIEWSCACGERLPDDLDCLACGRKYEKGIDGLDVVGS